MHDLRQRMNARIGAPGASRGNGLLRERCERFLKRILNRMAVRLRLPALPAAAVILQAERDSFQRNTLELEVGLRSAPALRTGITRGEAARWYDG